MVNYCAAKKMSELLLCATRRNFNVGEDNSDTAKRERRLHNSISMYFTIRQNYSVVLLRKENGGNDREGA